MFFFYFPQQPNFFVRLAGKFYQDEIAQAFKVLARAFLLPPSQFLKSSFFSIQLNLTVLFFSSKIILKTVLQEKHLLNGKEKISNQLTKKSLCSGTRVKPCFSQRITPVFEASRNRVNCWPSYHKSFLPPLQPYTVE